MVSFPTAGKHPHVCVGRKKAYLAQKAINPDKAKSILHHKGTLGQIESDVQSVSGSPFSESGNERDRECVVD